MVTKKDKERKKRKIVSAKRWAQEAGTSGFARTAIRLPENMKSFRITKAGTYRLDVVPFEVGPKAALFAQGAGPRADEGEYAHVLTFYTHRNVGANEDSYVCLAKTYGKPCPVCKDMARLKREHGWEGAKHLNYSEREIRLVRDRDDKANFDEVQLWDMSFFLFGQHLQSKVNNADDDEYDDFADPDEGFTLKIVAVDAPGGYGYLCSNIEFKKREPLEEDLLNRAVDLCELPIELPYKKLESILHSGVAPDDNGGETSADDEDQEEEAEEEEEAPRKKPAKKHNLVAGDYVLYEGKKCEIVKVSDDGTSLKLEDARGKHYTAVGPDEVEKIDDEEEEEEAPRKKTAAKKPARKAKDDEEDEDEAEDDSDEDEDEDEDTEEEDEDQPRRARKAKDDDEEDEDEDQEDEDEDEDEEGAEEEEEEEQPRRNRGRKR